MTTLCFSIAGVYPIFLHGIRHELGIRTSQPFDLGNGLYYVYFDPGLTLTFSKVAWDVQSGIAPVALLYLTDTGYVIFEKRYYAGRNLTWHKDMETRFGPGLISGFDAVFTDTTLSIGEGQFKDLDVVVEIPAQTSCRLWYKNIESFRFLFDAEVSVPYKLIGGVFSYGVEGNFFPVEVGHFSISWVFATNTDQLPIQILISDSQYVTIEQALDFKPKDLIFPDPLTLDKLLIYKLIYKSSATGPVLADVEDYRGVTGAFPYINTTYTEVMIDRAITRSAKLELLQDVDVVDKSDGDILTYVGSTSAWTNVPRTQITDGGAF
jgi:hypothetical protein